MCWIFVTIIAQCKNYSSENHLIFSHTDTISLELQNDIVDVENYYYFSGINYSVLPVYTKNCVKTQLNFSSPGKNRDQTKNSCVETEKFLYKVQVLLFSDPSFNATVCSDKYFPSS